MTGVKKMNDAIKNIYVIIAREVSTDNTDGMNSIIKIIDQFIFNINKDELDKHEITLGKQSLNLPATYSIATSWSFGQKLKEKTSYIFKNNVIDPDGNDLGGPEQKSEWPAGIDRINMNFIVQGLAVKKSGNYKIQSKIYSMNNDLLSEGEYPFKVEIIEDPGIKNDK